MIEETTHKLAIGPDALSDFVTSVVADSVGTSHSLLELDQASNEADVDGPSPEFVKTLVDDFFPDMQNTVRSRMLVNPVAKLALGSACAEVLTQMSDTNAFFECGSTIALAVLAMRNSLPCSDVVENHNSLATNSALVQTALYELGDSVPRLLYGDKWLNAKKYLGFFPIRPKTIQEAIDGRNWARSELQDAWQQMCRDGAAFRVSFVTASRFHFVVGPFVGSVDNSFLKYAFYSSGRDLRVLIDGSKIIHNSHLPDEWRKPHCHGSFQGLLTDDALSDYIKTLFPDGSTNKRERLMQAAHDASHRNPQSAVSLPPVFVQQLEHSEQATDDGTEEIVPAHSWPECVEQVLSRQGGILSVYVSQPDSVDGFEDRLADAIEEANACLRKLRSRLHIQIAERKEVFVHKPTRRLLETNDGQGCEVVPVWRCAYHCRNVEARRSTAVAARPFVNQEL